MRTSKIVEHHVQHDIVDRSTRPGRTKEHSVSVIGSPADLDDRKTHFLS